MEPFDYDDVGADGDLDHDVVLDQVQCCQNLLNLFMKELCYALSNLVGVRGIFIVTCISLHFHF